MIKLTTATGLVFLVTFTRHSCHSAPDGRSVAFEVFATHALERLNSLMLKSVELLYFSPCLCFMYRQGDGAGISHNSIESSYCCSSFPRSDRLCHPCLKAAGLE